MGVSKNNKIWESYYEKKIIALGFDGKIPTTLVEKEKLFNDLKLGSNQTKTSIHSQKKETDIISTKKQNTDSKLIQNPFQQDIKIEYIRRLGWRGHENHTMEQLIELFTTINNYFRLYKYSYEFQLHETPEPLKNYSVKELKHINEKFEKRVLKSNRSKLKKETRS